MRKGQLAIVTKEIPNCGCDFIPANTICKVTYGKKDKDGDIKVEFREEGSEQWVNEPKYLRPATEKELAVAKEKFSKATRYTYASIN